MKITLKLQALILTASVLALANSCSFSEDKNFINQSKGIHSEPLFELEFIQYSEAIMHLSNPSKSDDYDYLTILLLDSAEIERIKLVEPETVRNFREYYSSPIREEYINRISTNKKTLSECFADAETRDRIIYECIHEEDRDGVNFSSEIYIKDDKIAIFEIHGSFWSEQNRITINNKQLSIKEIDSVIQ